MQDAPAGGRTGATGPDPVERLLSVRQHRRPDGERSPHKRLLMLLALERLSRTASSAMRWSEVEEQLGTLIGEFGRPSRTQPAQAAAYPFTRLRSDGVWDLDVEMQNDALAPLRERDPIGRLTKEVEVAVIRRGDIPGLARRIAEEEFAPTVVPDVLLAVGFDPDVPAVAGVGVRPDRRRPASWPSQVLTAWDRQCAFCGFDGQLGGHPVGLEAAHVRWFTHGGPDDLDNGLALCTLHHKLLDRGALGFDSQCRVVVSSHFSARADASRALYDLHGRALSPRPGTPTPADAHLAWHHREVFRGPAIAP